MGVIPLAKPKVTFLWTAALAVLLWVGLGEPAWAQVSGISGQEQLAVEAEPESSIQPYLDRVANDVSEFTLDNGMKFIVLERHQAPVVSMMLYAKVGAVNEEDGHTGVAHYLEHLAFKGTTQIGTKDYSAEAPLLQEMDVVFDQLMAAEKSGDEEKTATLRSQFDTLQSQAAEYVEQNKFGQIIEQSGGRGLNATTSADATRYFYSLPSNKLELWMSLESERFIDPVFREFYKEKEVILEERRMRVDNSPIGQIVEKFLEVAFDQHPYRRPVIGYKEDLRLATREDIAKFFDAYYGPSNLIAAVVGDVDPDNVKALATAYFGRTQSRSLPPEVGIQEPPQTEPKSFELKLPSQPWYLEGFHRPGINHSDHVVYAMIESILVGGRTSRMYQDMVVQSQVALNIGSANGFPGDRYDNILLLYGLTAPGHTVDDMAERMDVLLTQIKQEPVTPEELDRVKTQARASLLRNLDSNAGMASLLTEYEAKTNDWRNVFEELKAIEAVTAEDVQRVAQATFVPSNRTVGKLLSTEP
ncbi:pitrilysin family protein [Leptothoe sp. ISB3NOV94-8A]|nr:pitrilysin family protein [Leptothoe sp. LEGE 181152]